MGLHEDICLVNEANAFAYDSSQWPWWRPTRKLAAYLRLVTNAFYRVKESLEAANENNKSADQMGVANRIEIEQRLAHMLVVHAEDKKNPPYIHSDGAYDIGLKSLRILAVEVSERIDQIVRFRDVLARNLLEQREEHERRLGELRDQIKVKDEALLAAAERIKGQAEALTNAARKQPWRRPCESIHEPYSGKCEHCQPPSEQDIAEMNAQH